MTPAEALGLARALAVDRLDAQVLLERAIGKSRTWLMAHDDEPLDDALTTPFAADLLKRAAGVPLAYLTGEKEFFGLMLEVTPAVLVPRPETEMLVEWTIERIDAAGTTAAVLDLGTGSGAIAVALAQRRRAARVVGSDASEAALAVARRNAARHGVAIDWRSGSWWRALNAAERFDVVVSNPPYVAAGDPHLAALHAEPPEALVSGADGLDAIRQIIGSARDHLRPGGWLLLEHGFDQGEAVAALLDRHGFDSIAMRCDLAGRPRCTGGRST